MLGVEAELRRELARLIGPEHVLPGETVEYLQDAAAQVRGFRGRAAAVALPGTAEEVAAVVAWCYERDVPIVPRGGGTGYAGGAVPLGGGVVLSLERLTRVRSFEPLLWRMEVEAGVRTADVRRLARESGLFFPPDPGAAEQSQIGGNIATNAGGPHAFKYGVTGTWVTGLEAVLPPGELVRVGGAVRKDVASYDLVSLLVGSEGTLGVITAAWLRLAPAPEAFLPVVGLYGGTAAGCAAIERVVGSGLVPAALEYLDRGTIAASGATFPQPLPPGAGFMVIAEADGSRGEAERLQADLFEALGEGALATLAPATPAEVAALWRWRDTVSGAVAAVRGRKAGEDIAVPLDRLAKAIEATVEIGARHGLESLSWGHAGDGNLHSNFLIASDGDQERVEEAVEELFALAVSLGGSVSGEHGLGFFKAGQLARQLSPRALELHRAIKAAFDPKGLLNPGKKA